MAEKEKAAIKTAQQKHYKDNDIQRNTQENGGILPSLSINKIVGEFDDTSQSDTNRKIVRASDLLSRGTQEIPMLFAPVFPRKGVALFAGTSDAGKSMLLRNMAIAVVTGRDFLGWRFKGVHRSCIFVATEDDEEATSYLLGKHEKTYGDAIADLHSLRFIFNSENIISELDNELSIEPADLVIVDAYSDVFDGKEQNNAAQTRTFINKFKMLAGKHDCLFLFLHHTGKRTEDLAPSKNNFVGSQSLEASVRLGIELRTDRGNPDLRHLCIVKGNYLGRQFKQSSFVLKMDENFTFADTGDRVPFDELALQPMKKGQPSGKRPGDYTKEQHLSFLREVALSPASKNKLSSAAEKHFSISDRPARDFIEYYIKEGLLKEVDGKTYPEYQICEGNLPF